MKTKINIKSLEVKLVEYDGDRFELKPGHSVYELNEQTGEVNELQMIKVLGDSELSFGAKLARKLSGVSITQSYYVAEKKPGYSIIPAYDIHKARVAFKQVFSKTHVKVIMS